MPKISQHADSEAGERRRSYILDNGQDRGNIYSFNRLIFVSATSPIVLCMYNPCRLG